MLKPASEFTCTVEVIPVPSVLLEVVPPLAFQFQQTISSSFIAAAEETLKPSGSNLVKPLEIVASALVPLEYNALVTPRLLS